MTPAIGTDFGQGEEDDDVMDIDTPERPQSSELTAAPPPTQRERNAGHVVAIVVGCLMLLPGFGLLAGGGAAASAQAFATDDGYFTFTPDRIRADGVAIAATDMMLDDGADDDAPGWLLDALDVDLRLRVSGASPTDEVFVGIARTQDVQRYLTGATYSDVVDVDGHALRFDEIAGSLSVDAPATQDFWAVSVAGDGEQVIEWNARGGHWSLVVMNLDGSPAVVADIEIGVHAGAVMPVAVVFMILGSVLLVGAVVLIVVGARGRRVSGIEGMGQAATVLPPPGPVDAARLDSDDRTPVG